MSKLDDDWLLVRNKLQSKLSVLFMQLWIDTLNPLEIRNRVLYIMAVSDKCKERCMDKNSEGYEALRSAIKMVYGSQIDRFEIMTREEYLNADFSDNEVEENKEQTTAPRIENNFNPKYTFENFIVGNSNTLVYAAAKSVAENPGKKYNPLFIYGGVGLGKTHLLHAIGIKISEEKPKLKVLYSTCDNFLREYITSLSGGQNNAGGVNGAINAFREKYRNVDVLLIDDIHNLMGKKESQEEFFNTFRDLFEANRQIVLTSDRAPDDIKDLEDRLLSRFKGGLSYSVSKPDYETKVAILEKKVAQESYNVPQDIIDMLAKNMDTNIRELEGMLQKVVFSSEFKHKPHPDIEDVKSCFNDANITGKKETITAERIIDVICTYTNIQKEDIVGKKKTKDLAYARQIAMYLIRDLLGMPFENIGDLFGGKDHTTVMHARDKIAEMMKTNIELQGIIKDLKDKLN